MGIKKTAFIVIILLTAMFACSAVGSPVRAIGVTGTITFSGESPSEPVYDSGKGEIFVSNYPQTYVISDKTNKVIATINVNGTVSGIAYDSGKDEVFESVQYNTVYPSGAVKVISDVTDSVVATIPMGFFAGPVAYDSGKNEIFVAQYTAQLGTAGNNSVWVISDTNNSVVAKIPIPYSPSDLVYDSGKGEIFTANNGGFGGDSVTVISDNNNTVVANIIVGGEWADPMCLAYDSAKGEVFVTNNGEGTVAVISDATNMVVAYVTVGYYPMGIAYDSGRGEIYVAHLTNPPGGFPNSTYIPTGQRVSVIADANNTVVATISNINDEDGIVYDSAKGELFVAGSDTVTVISDCPNLTSPNVSASPTSIQQGQTSVLSLGSLTTGTSPYTYQWFIKAPNATNFQPISNATSTNYNFTTTTSTAAGNWTFMLQVTDATGAVVNSTATLVTVNAPLGKNVSGLSAKDLSIALAAIILAAAVTVTLLLRKERTEKRKTKENQT